MVYASCKENEINLWWDEREDKSIGMRYKVIINGINCSYTNGRFYDFKNLESGKEFNFQIQVVDKNDKVIGKTEQIIASTLKKRKIVNIALEPYNAVGDAKTDNTSIIQRAIDENPILSEIYIPFGSYICGKLSLNGDFNLKLAVGAKLISPSEEERKI